MFYEWSLDTVHDNPFVMVDSNNIEAAGLTVAAFVSKNGELSFSAGAGTVTEKGNGWYSYQNTAEEADTLGPVAIRFTATGAVTQNIIAVVESLVSNAIAHTYTVTDGSNPIAGVRVEISTDSLQQNLVWSGTTDSLGVARDGNAKLPYLQAGTYYFWSVKAGYIFSNPDMEIIA